MNATMQQLAAVLPALGSRDREFATSLLRSYARYGSLTAGQAPYVQQLIDRAIATALPASAVTTRTVGDFAAVIDLFTTARRSLKYPKVRLLLPNGQPVILSVAGQASKAPGTVNVTSEGSFEARTWYGRVQPTGEWQPARQVNPATVDALAALLSEFGRDPNGTAAAYGRATNSCCFCARELTDARSVAAGYGPICAEHYGLSAEWSVAANVSIKTPARPSAVAVSDDPIAQAATVTVAGMDYTPAPWKPEARTEVSPAVSAFIDSIDFEPEPPAAVAPSTPRRSSGLYQADLWGAL